MQADQSLNMSKVSDDKTLVSYLRFLSDKIEKNTYYTVGDFLEKMPDKDFQELLEDVEKFSFKNVNSKTTFNLTMLVSMLSLGEGKHDIPQEDYGGLLNRIFDLIVLAKSFRKGYTQVLFRNFSLFDMKQLAKEQ